MLRSRLSAMRKDDNVSSEGQATGLDVAKTLVFDGDRYSADLEVTIKRGDQIVPQAKTQSWPKHRRPGRQTLHVLLGCS